MEQFNGRTVKEIKLDSQDDRIIHIWFTDDTELEITAYAEFDGCNDFDGTYFFLTEKEPKGGIIWEKDTNK